MRIRSMLDHSITWHALSSELQLLAALTAFCACLALLLSIVALCRTLDSGCVRLGAAAARGIADHLDPDQPPFTPCASSKRTSGATLPSPPAAHIAIPPPPGFRSSAAGYQPHVQNLHSLKQPSAELLLARLQTHTHTPAAQLTGRAAAIASGPSTRATAPSLAPPPAQPALRPPMHEWGPPSASPPLPSHSIAMPSPPLPPPGRPPLLPPAPAAVAAAIASAAVSAAVPTSPSARSNPGQSAAAPTSPSGRPTAGQSAAAANLLAGLRVAAVNLKARQATMRSAEPPQHRVLM